jgi:hypothetical protein
LSAILHSSTSRYPIPMTRTKQGVNAKMFCPGYLRSTRCETQRGKGTKFKSSQSGRYVLSVLSIVRAPLSHVDVIVTYLLRYIPDPSVRPQSSKLLDATNHCVVSIWDGVMRVVERDHLRWYNSDSPMETPQYASSIRLNPSVIRNAVPAGGGRVASHN